MKKNTQIKFMKLFLLGSKIVFLTSLSRATGVAGSGGTYSCQGKSGKMFTLQEITQSQDMKQAFGNQLYSDYLQLVSKAHIISDTIETVLEKITTSQWILLSKYDCEIQSSDQMKVGPLNEIIKPLISASFDTYWVHKDFMKSAFDGPKTDINSIRLMALINEALVYNKVNYQKSNTARWAAEASALIYLILKQPDLSEADLKSMKDRLALIIGRNLSKTED